MAAFLFSEPQPSEGKCFLQNAPAEPPFFPGSHPGKAKGRPPIRSALSFRLSISQDSTRLTSQILESGDWYAVASHSVLESITAEFQIKRFFL